MCLLNRSKCIFVFKLTLTVTRHTDRLKGPGQTESQVIASWKIAITCNPIWPWRAYIAMACDGPFTLIEHKFSAPKWMQVFNYLATQRKSTLSLIRARAQTSNEMGFCKLRWTCVYLQVRLATHNKSVYACWHFQTCVDLRLRLAWLNIR